MQSSSFFMLQSCHIHFYKFSICAFCILKLFVKQFNARESLSIVYHVPYESRVQLEHSNFFKEKRLDLRKAIKL